MTLYFGLLGEKLQHSLSPKIHEAFFREYGINACYNLFEVEKSALASAVEGLKALGFRGVNVTIPYKTDVMRLLDQISREAREIGAVNTICFKNGAATGYNTDYTGFGNMLKSFEVNLKDRTAVVLGTGGASRAVVHYLADNGIKDITIVSRDKNRIRESIAADLLISAQNLMDYEQLRTLPSMDLLINCTPCGMYPNVDASPADRNIVGSFSTVIDLIYNPSETLLLKYAKDAGAKVINGLYMLVSQAAAAEELWNSISIGNQSVFSIYSSLL